MNYRTAPEASEMARDLIQEVDELEFLSGEPIEYVMLDSTPKKNGREMCGRARIVGGLNAFLSARPKPEKFDDHVPVLLVVEVSLAQWQVLGAERRRGLIDHLLSHFHLDLDSESWTIIPPEFGEFPGTLRRHGFWRPDHVFKDFASQVSEQLSLLPPEERVIAGMDSEFREQIQSGQVEIGVNS